MQTTQSTVKESVSFSPHDTGNPSLSTVLSSSTSLPTDNTLDVTFPLFLAQIRPHSYMLKELRIASNPRGELPARQQPLPLDRAAAAASDRLAGAAVAARFVDRRTAVGRRRAQFFPQRRDCEPGEPGATQFSE